MGDLFVPSARIYQPPAPLEVEVPEWDYPERGPRPRHRLTGRAHWLLWVAVTLVTTVGSGLAGAWIAVMVVT
jgi:hypothetical protein